MSGLVLGVASAVTIAVLAAIFVELARTSAVIEPISVPKTLDEHGYSSSVAAQSLHDSIGAIIARAKSRLPVQAFVLDAQSPDVIVPGVGLSLKTVAYTLMNFLRGDSRQALSGEFTLRKGRLRLTLRMNRDVLWVSRDGDPEDPDALLRVAAHQVVETMRPYYIAAALYAQASPQNNSRALREIDAIVDRLPPADENVFEAINLRGVILYRLGHPAEALAAYRAAYRADPEFAMAHFNAGIALLKLERTKDAMAEFLIANALDPNYAHPYNGLGIAYQDEGRQDDAERAYRRCIALDAKNEEPHLNLGYLLFEKRDYKAAEDEYRSAVALQPRDPNAHRRLGEALEDENKKVEAEKEFRRSTRLGERHGDNHDALATLLKKEHRLDEALAEYKRAAHLDAKDADGLFGVAATLTQQIAERRGRLDRFVMRQMLHDACSALRATQHQNPQYAGLAGLAHDLRTQYARTGESRSCALG